MNPAVWVQILDEAVYISYGVNTLEESMNPTNIHPAMCE